ncbi:unnamed protein product [Caenorhabditis nigoni]
MDHWNNAEQLNVDRNVFVILDVLKLEHFLLVEVKMDRLRGKELLELKEKLLSRPEFAEFNFDYVNFDDEKGFSDFLGPESMKFFQMENSEDVLRITHNSEIYSVNFKRIRKENFPEGFSIY